MFRTLMVLRFLDELLLPNGLEHEVAPGDVQAEYGDVVNPLHQLAAATAELSFRLQQQHQS